MKSYIFKFIKLLLVFLLYSNANLAQQPNNSPIIYRYSRTGIGLVGTGRVVGLDALTGTQVKEIFVPVASSQIELSLDKKKAFIPGATIPGPVGQGAIVVDLNQESTMPFLQDKKIFRLKVSPMDGTLWALLGDDNQIVILDPNNLKAISKIDSIEKPTDIIFTPNGKKAYVSLRANTIVEIDTETKSMRNVGGLPQTTVALERPREMALSPDNKTLYIASKGVVSIIDTEKLFVRDNFSFVNKSFSEQAKLLIHPNGKTLYIIDGGEHLYSYDIASGNIQTIYTVAPLSPTQGSLQDFSITSDGKILYLSGFRGRVIIDAQNNSVISDVIESGFGTQNFEGIVLVGDFAIGQAPTIQTILPTASQQLLPNQQFTIAWQTTVTPQSFSIASHKIEVSTDGGSTFNVIQGAEKLKAEAQSFTWNVPDIEVSKAQIRVSTVDLGARRAASTTGNFSISKNGGSTGDTQPPSVTFNSPKGGERFNSGDSLQISWTSSDNVGVTAQDLSLSTDGGATFPITLASGLSGATQNFTYQIPMSLQSDQTRLRLIVRDGAGNNAQAVTANNFSILLGADTINPTVTISQPSQAQSIVAGQPIQVKWQSTDNRAVVSQALLLSFDGGKTFSQISSFGATDNSFILSGLDKLNLTIPQAVVKITAIDSTGNKGEANSLFTIAPAIMMASYQAKVLSVSGIGFMSNVNNTIRLFINDKEVTLPPTSVSNNSFTLKANKKKLGIVKGSNTIRLVVDGVMSNSFSFQF